MKAFSALICKISGHKWRRARKGEVVGLKYCHRCPVSQVIKRRVKA